jgi:nitroreductase/dihydropteridine reductase
MLSSYLYVTITFRYKVTKSNNAIVSLCRNNLNIHKMKLIEDLKWRYAVKKFNNKRVTDDKFETIVEAIRLSASSTGMQTYRLFVIENPEIRKELGAGIGSFNSQIVEASHLLLFAAFDSVTQETIDNYIQFVATERNIPLESLNDFNKKLGVLLSRSNEENFQWSAKQAYIALGTGLIAAASEQVDATPMEGFDAAKADKILGLKEKGLKSVVLLALGYRDEENDWNVKLKKVRIAKEEFVTVVK